MITRADLLRASRAELRALLEGGHPVDPAELADTVYRGISLGLPAWVERLSWKKFAKAFHRDPRTGALRGWNIRIEQDGLDQPWRARTRRGRTWTFGHFAVVREAEHLVLDYGAGRALAMRAVRDPLVALEAGSARLLLGRSDVALGPARLATPSYFVLEREGPLALADVAVE
ncbi:MAG TPA: hypothetical protein VLT45_19275 [Kofleriaceae bacterium]|nr:hypothetical protein [Kofleriaceae bacterium]